MAEYLYNNPDDLNVGWIISDDFIMRLDKGDKDAIGRYQKICKIRSVTGKGYFFKVDTVNRQNPQIYKDKGLEVLASQLCVAPETLILTSEGYQPICNLEDEEVQVWNGEEWSTVTVKKTGTDQKLVKVKTNSGFELECTPYHKFYVAMRNPNSGKRWTVEKRAHELQKGDKLIKCKFPIIEGSEELSDAYANGFYSSDRGLTSHRLLDKFFVPSGDYMISSKVEWFAGLCDADGTIARNGKTQSLQVASVNKEFLQEIQMMLQTIGVSSKVTLGKKDLYRLLISQAGICTLFDLGFAPHRLVITDHTPNRECSQFVKVESVEDEGRVDDTYCFNEPKRHMGVFNGLLTGQCTEIMLHSSTDLTYTCVLSSMNLAKYDEWKDTDAVFVSTVFLDCVAQEFIEFGKNIKGLEKAVKFTELSRALGLGVLGFHTYLQDNMIEFGSFEARRFNKEVFKKLNDESLEASKWMAKTMGEPEWCKGYGVRSTHRLAVAPTMSTSLICGGNSQGIEPVVANVYNQNSAGGEVFRINPSLLKIMKDRGMYDKRVLKRIAANNGSVSEEPWLSDEEKRVFLTAYEIEQEVIVKMASDRQKYIDQGQSLNLFFSADETEEYVSKINKMVLKDPYIKSLYYQRSLAGVKASSGECTACEA